VPRRGVQKKKRGTTHLGGKPRREHSSTKHRDKTVKGIHEPEVVHQADQTMTSQGKSLGNAGWGGEVLLKEKKLEFKPIITGNKTSCSPDYLQIKKTGKRKKGFTGAVLLGQTTFSARLVWPRNGEPLGEG